MPLALSKRTLVSTAGVRLGPDVGGVPFATLDGREQLF